MPSISEAWLGPPPVSTYTVSKTWNAPMTLSRTASPSTGFISGATMCRATVKALAPSIAAASTSSRATPSMPARSSTIVQPVHCHDATQTITYLTSCGSESQPTGSMPRMPSTPFTGPSNASIWLQAAPTTTIERTVGRKMSARIAPERRGRRCQSANASTNPTPTCTTVESTA